MRSLSILFTNNTLRERAGSELWVRDVCRALIGRGHRPVAFSLALGAIADELRAATVPVVSSLDKVGFIPDLIHGHHHLETLMAALHFPGVPIVHFCHGFLPWEEAPLHHPSIARYVAVDAACADRLTAEEGIAPERIERLLNFVDLQRFAQRSPLPRRPKRALVLSNQAEPGGYAETIREACQQSGIDLEVAGLRWGRVIERPEDLLAGMDLVFAKGRTALEAMAVGCAVVLADIFGRGPLVTLREFDEMRSSNFGIRLLREPHSVDWYRSQIAAYDASEAGRISARVRQDAGLDEAVDHLLEIYDRAIAEGRNCASRQAADHEAQRAAARHLSSVAGRFKHAYGLERTVQSLSAELTTSRSLNERLVEERGGVLHQVADYHRLERTVQSLSAELTTARSLNEQLGEERGDLRQKVADYQGLERTVQSLSAELTTARSRHERLIEECEGLRRQVADYQGLSILRLRDAIVGVPILGGMARWTGRWLNRSSFLRAPTTHPQPEGLISVLLDRNAPFGDRDDAAMDLAAFETPESENALTSIVLDLTEDDDLVERAAESLADIWTRTRRFNRDVFARLPDAATPIFLAMLDARWPEWRKLSDG